jgi:hypothetical protein
MLPVKLFFRRVNASVSVLEQRQELPQSCVQFTSIVGLGS